MTPEPMAVSVVEAARLLGISRTRVYEELVAGRLKSFKVGRRTLLSRRELDAWIDAREQSASAA
jgi:excisionase family DNA binding protein